MKKNSGYIWKLGMFVIIGIVIFIITLYVVGKNRNLFGSTFHLKSKFKNVNGLKIGNNVRFSGINIGTVEDIDFESDTVVIVNLLIKEEVQQYIKIDAIASIGSDGLMGDKVLSILPGTTTKSIVTDGASILSNESIEMGDIMKSVKISVDNATVISEQFAQFSYKMNNNDGALTKFMTDASFANSLEKTLLNLESSSNEFTVFTKKLNNKNGALSKFIIDTSFANSLEKTLANLESSSNEFAVFSKKINTKKGILSKLVNDEKLGNSMDTIIINIQTATQKLNELEEAAKHNFLLRGYFNKKEKEEVRNKK